VRLAPDSPLDLTYCTNIHPADGWDAVFAALRQYGPALRSRLSLAAPFGIGLRLSARDARELLEGDRLHGLRAFLDDYGLYVALINGFPYGPFHGAPVKADVYAPDWRDDARVAYTLDLVKILTQLLPEGMDGGVSTAPLTYKAWLHPDDAGPALKQMARHVARVAAELARLARDRGVHLHLDIEPEPDCALETSAETVAFVEDALLPEGAPILTDALGITPSQAERALRDHVQVCFDCCHFAVEFESPRAALDRLAAAGIGVGRIQLSSALDVPLPSDERRRAQVLERLRPFADPVYLHQVVEQGARRLQRFPDLDDALAASSAGDDRRWRIHFHVPLFTGDYDGLSSTQAYVAEVLALARNGSVTSHLEIETYTWDVLPGALKIDLLDSIEREYRWVLRTLAAHGS
jgi:sugar phosphate isomerase/epimerase